MKRGTALWLAIGTLVAFGGCADRGRKVFVREGCGVCHRFREIGSGGAPDLSEIGSRRDAAWIATQIRRPATHDPASRMPPFPHIGWFELRSLIAFLRS